MEVKIHTRAGAWVALEVYLSAFCLLKTKGKLTKDTPTNTSRITGPPGT